MLLPSFVTCRNGCTVADGVWFRPHLAFFQQLQGLLPALSLRTRTDGCVVGACVWCRSCLAVFQQLHGPFPTPALRTRTDGYVVGGRVRPYLLSAHTL